jgi:hypothetical protein
MVENLYNTKFIVANMTEIVANDNQLHASCMPVACQLHSDWLQTTRFLVVLVTLQLAVLQFVALQVHNVAACNAVTCGGARACGTASLRHYNLRRY